MSFMIGKLIIRYSNFKCKSGARTFCRNTLVPETLLIPTEISKSPERLMKLAKTSNSSGTRLMGTPTNSQSSPSSTRNAEAQQKEEILGFSAKGKCRNHSKMLLLHSRLVKLVTLSSQTAESILYCAFNDYSYHQFANIL